MIMFIGGRGSGKTRRCIEFSARTRIPILCQRPDFIKLYAKEHGLDIPGPISYSEYLSGKGINLSSDRRVIIDELGLFLKLLGLSPEYVTIDESGNYITRDEEKKAST